MIKTLVAQVVCLLGCFFAIAKIMLLTSRKSLLRTPRFERPASKKSRSVTLLTTKDIEPYVGSSTCCLAQRSSRDSYQSDQTLILGLEPSYFVRGGNNRQVLF